MYKIDRRGGGGGGAKNRILEIYPLPFTAKKKYQKQKQKKQVIKS